MSSLKKSLSAPRKANTTTPVIEDWCHSKAVETVFKYNWTIDHFSCRCESGQEYIESSIFPTHAANDVPKWRMRAYPIKWYSHDGDFLELSIVSQNESRINAEFTCSILNDKKEETNTKTSTRSFCKKGECKWFSKFLKRDTLLNEATVLLPQDTLTILCKISVISDNVNFTSQSSNVAQYKVPHNNLANDLKTLLDYDVFRDVTLVAADGHELQAHKIILAARSKVFAEMFEHIMEEYTLICYQTHIDHEVLKKMLNYIYTDKVPPNLDNMAEDLFVAADKYELENLKVICEESLRTTITIDKAAGTLILADRHNAEQLKSDVIKFIISNVSGVIESQGWRDLTASHSHLIIETMCPMASKQLQICAPDSSKPANSTIPSKVKLVETTGPETGTQHICYQLKCCNCGGAHAANFKGCPTRLAYIKRMNKGKKKKNTQILYA